jgi:hypothetical protein
MVAGVGGERGGGLPRDGEKMGRRRKLWSLTSFIRGEGEW